MAKGASGLSKKQKYIYQNEVLGKYANLQCKKCKGDIPINNVGQTKGEAMADITEQPDFVKKNYRDYLIIDECSLTRYVGTRQIDDLRTFSATVEQLVATENARMSSTYSGPPQDYSGWWLQDVVSRQLRQSVVAACLDAAAWHLNHVCQDVSTITNQDCPDLSRKAVQTARTFLGDAGFSSPSAGQWDELLDLYKFRSMIVHSMAMASADQVSKKFGRLLRRAPGIAVRSSSFDLSVEFTQYVHAKVSEFFDSLHQEVVAMCRRIAAQQSDPANPKSLRD